MPAPINLRLQQQAAAEGVGADLLARDLLQSRLIAAIFSGTTRREIVLKGGMAMRAGHGSHRFTKDIDLQTGPEIPTGRVAQIMRGAIKDALSIGVITDVQVSEPKQTETVQRWKINGNLPDGGSHINITLEVSRRGLPEHDDVMGVEYAPIVPGDWKTAIVEVYSPTKMAEAKTLALLSSNRLALRDIFDLDVLITTLVEPPIHMLKDLGSEVLTASLEIVWDKIMTMTWRMAQEELLPTLRPDMAAKVKEDDWDAMRLRTAEAVQHWLSRARDLALEEEFLHEPAEPPVAFR